MNKQIVDVSNSNHKWFDILSDLAASIEQYTAENSSHLQHETSIPGLIFFRHDEPTPPERGTYAPSICLVAQGAKKAQLGDEEYVYDAHNYLITSVHLPTTFRVIKATEEEPYLGLLLRIDIRELSQLMIDSNIPLPRTKQTERCIATGEVSLPLLASFQRLIKLIDTPEDIPILAPLYQREILYRLLTGAQGQQLRLIASVGSQSNQIAKAIEWLQKNFDQPLRVDDLANQTNMSSSSFHSHFRAMTSLSPLQYQKQLRLQEARRLMIAENLDATRAAFQVGYESSSQFNREYSRLFGAPPLRDVAKLRQVAC